MNALRLQRPRRPSRRPSRRIGRSRFASDRGAAAVEFALVAALLIPFVYGVIDYGLLWQKRQTVQGATRQGAREAATTCLVSNDPANTCDAGNRANDDYRVLVAARSVLGGALDQVQTMVVYRIQANGYVDSLPDGTHPPITNGMPVALCREAAATGGVDGYCNVYGPEVLAALDAMTPADRDLVFSCDPFAPAGQGLSKYFCPTGGLRGRSVGANASIGVFIRLRHSHLTGLFGASSEVTDYTVFRLEPNGSAPTAPDVLTPPPPPPTTTTVVTTTTTTTIATTTTTNDPTTTVAPTSTTTVAPATTTTDVTTTTASPITTTTIAVATSTGPPFTGTTTTDPPTTTTTTLPPPTTTTTTTLPPPPTTTTTTLPPPPTSTTTTKTTTSTTTTTRPRSTKPCC